ncbi:hypothetical protein [Xylophilus sp. GOD-11R]|uniref:hypothetical protein n=1 Tax=Xylophilus sp. GOD-11R TaxID=3089814 RepID=UPI00298CDC3F|nr:hypothetical protein [Xylophilus sp. GOD-11R]WPB56190.1 hypothetical protein R9X41_18890 [Xylophilus sp. GOD-11R]
MMNFPNRSIASGASAKIGNASGDAATITSADETTGGSSPGFPREDVLATVPTRIEDWPTELWMEVVPFQSHADRATLLNQHPALRERGSVAAFAASIAGANTVGLQAAMADVRRGVTPAGVTMTASERADIVVAVANRALGLLCLDVDVARCAPLNALLLDCLDLGGTQSPRTADRVATTILRRAPFHYGSGQQVVASAQDRVAGRTLEQLRKAVERDSADVLEALAQDPSRITFMSRMSPGEPDAGARRMIETLASRRVRGPADARRRLVTLLPTLLNLRGTEPRSIVPALRPPVERLLDVADSNDLRSHRHIIFQAFGLLHALPSADARSLIEALIRYATRITAELPADQRAAEFSSLWEHVNEVGTSLTEEDEEAVRDVMHRACGWR